MKFLVLVFVSFIGVNALSEKDQWSKFKQIHGKNYKNNAEENYRFAVFQNNLREINEHNERYRNGETTYFLGVNKFADRTSAEFRSMFKNQKTNLPNLEVKLHELPKEVKVTEAAFDWRSKGVVLPVRDQGDCGGSWQFAVAASLESQNAIINNITVQLSTQQFIDCAIPLEECNIGGFMETGFKYATIISSIMPESEYPFVGAQSVCKADTTKGIVRGDGLLFDGDNEGHLQEVISTNGPAVSTINADCIQLYAGGIFSNSSCPNTLDDINFAVLNVGYDTSPDGIDYWILKNSWGIQWGEQGYLRLLRGNRELGIDQYNGIPYIEI